LLHWRRPWPSHWWCWVNSFIPRVFHHVPKSLSIISF
jgi:hypothetical protein